MFERDERTACLQQMQSRHKPMQSAVFPVQQGISAMGVGLKKCVGYFLRLQVTPRECVVVVVGKDLCGHLIKSKSTMYEEAMQMLDVNTSDWRTRLKKLSILEATSLAAASSLARATTDALFSTKIKRSSGASKVYRGSSVDYQFDLDGMSSLQ